MLNTAAVHIRYELPLYIGVLSFCSFRVLYCSDAAPRRNRPHGGDTANRAFATRCSVCDYHGVLPVVFGNWSCSIPVKRYFLYKRYSVWQMSDLRYSAMRALGIRSIAGDYSDLQYCANTKNPCFIDLKFAIPISAASIQMDHIETYAAKGVQWHRSKAKSPVQSMQCLQPPICQTSLGHSCKKSRTGP